jgi:hypothetical protein
MCRKHNAEARAIINRCRRADRERRKLSGRCVAHGCENLQRPDCLLCLVHTVEAAATHRRTRETRNAKRRRRFHLRVAKGLCGDCGKEMLRTKSLGDRCHALLLARTRKRDAGRVKDHCGTCGDPGHKTPTCRNWGAEDIRVENYLSSGGNNLAEAQR